MPATIEVKLLSMTMMSEASLVTAVPVFPIAIPTDASFKAGASLTPSPVIATTFCCFFQARTIFNLCSAVTRA